jgi:hypothetical protein
MGAQLQQSSCMHMIVLLPRLTLARRSPPLTPPSPLFCCTQCPQAAESLRGSGCDGYGDGYVPCDAEDGDDGGEGYGGSDDEVCTLQLRWKVGEWDPQPLGHYLGCPLPPPPVPLAALSIRRQR